MAMSMVAHYPDKPTLINHMVDLAIEELGHFRQVIAVILDREIRITADKRDPYVNSLRDQMRGDAGPYLPDRLLCGAVIEARGAERFSLISSALANDSALASLYTGLARSESRHYEGFVSLAEHYFPLDDVRERLGFWLATEAALIASLPVGPRLH